MSDGVALIDRMAATGRLAIACTQDLLSLLDVIALGTRELGQAVSSSSENEERLDRIRDATSRLGEITRMLIQLGRGPDPSAVVDMVALVDDLRRVLSRLVAPVGRLVIIRRGGELRVAADRRALEQALFNLVLYALDGAGGGRVTIETGLETWPGGVVTSGDDLPACAYATLTVSGEGGAGEGEVVGADDLAADVPAVDLASLRLALVARIARAAGGGLVVEGGPNDMTLRVMLPVVG